MDWWLLSFFFGALLSLFLPAVPTLFYVLLFTILSLAAYLWLKTRKLTLLFLGMAWMLFHGYCYQENAFAQDSVASTYQGKKLVVVGQIENIPQKNSKSTRFNLVVSSVDSQPIKQTVKIRLAWQKPHPALAQSQAWQLRVKLKPAHGLANPGGFSYQTWLRSRQIHATGYVAKFADNRLLDPSSSIRQQYFNQMNALLSEQPFGPIVMALTFGERSQLTKEHWQVLQDSATLHLIAISGLHLGLVATMSYFLLTSLMALFPLVRVVPKKYHASLIAKNNRFFLVTFTLLVTLIYAYFAGFTIPTVRAFLMLSLFWGARVIGVKLTVTRWLAATLFLVTLTAPFSLFTFSFWLSFYAVVIIFLLLWRFERSLSTTREGEYSYFSQIKQKFTAVLLMQFALVSLMYPLTSLLNHQISLAALVANLLAVPWMSFTTIPLCLLSVLLLPVSESATQAVLAIALKTIEWLWYWLSFLTEFSYATVNISANSWQLLTVALLLLALYYLMETRGNRFYFVGLALVSVLIFPRLLVHQQPLWQVSVMDVGQGLTVILEKNEQVMVYDTGASYPSGLSMADLVLVPYLKQQGAAYIERLVVSHDDNDHAGGLSYLSEQFEIKQLVYNKSPSALPCVQGQSFSWQSLSVEVLWPLQRKGEHNDDSCVMRITDGQTSILLTGDISAKVEQVLVNQYFPSNQLRSDYLVVPHHGSKTSSSLPFIKAVSPKLAIVSAGYLNRWRMPVDSVIARYQMLGVETLNTANQGMIRVEVYDNSSKVTRYREHLWPFWFAN